MLPNRVRRNRSSATRAQPQSERNSAATPSLASPVIDASDDVVETENTPSLASSLVSTDSAPSPVDALDDVVDNAAASENLSHCENNSQTSDISWSCPVCTFDNLHGDFLACEMCGTPRAGQTSEPILVDHTSPPVEIPQRETRSLSPVRHVSAPSQMQRVRSASPTTPQPSPRGRATRPGVISVAGIRAAAPGAVSVAVRQESELRLSVRDYDAASRERPLVVDEDDEEEKADVEVANCSPTNARQESKTRRDSEDKCQCQQEQRRKAALKKKMELNRPFVGFMKQNIKLLG